ncbi:MAG: PA2779 family protein [Nitrospirae bacterium]|nr:PA2779 family protein [Nitrospirota bacterium]
MLKKSISWYLVIAVFIISIVPNVEGAFIPSEAMAFNAAQRDADLGKVRAFLETKIVSQRLQDLGFSPDEVKEKLSLLSDGQIHNYAQQLDNLRVGGNGLEAVIAVLLIIILIILILHLTGHRVIVK